MLSHRFTQSLPKETYAFLVARLFNAMGSAFIWPLTTIYVHNVLHGNYATAGWVLFGQSLAGALGQFAGGAMYHRLGPMRLIVGSLLLTALAQWSLMLAHSLPPYAAAIAANSFLISATQPALNAFVGNRWKSVSARLFNTMYVMTNIGIAVGTALAGVIASVSFTLTFFLNGLLTLSFAAFMWRFLRRLGTESEDAPVDAMPQINASAWQLFRNYRVYALLGAGMLALSLALAAWNSGVAPYLNQTGHRPDAYSVLWTVNGMLILVGQPVIGWIKRRVAQSTAQLVLSSALYAAAFAGMAVAHRAYPALVAGMVVATFGEMLNAPTVPELVTRMTGPHAAFYLGLVGAIGNVGSLLGPVLFGHLFDLAGISPILWVATGASAAATAAFAGYSRVVRRLGDTPGAPNGMRTPSADEGTQFTG
ncbi:MFS transporter [Alicyclobacillus acidocaldarius]|uniref:Major facilitator superfamily MFS_1 n=1 Tax=Alicyclobacillus acidocaldarius (strain Tc-4-1) TaxID=1048834 RepID=F8IKX7_ALIAT|nr:MFS transporter [Alicyclobacillus acidocaldarius]AEJ42357.1 major facilitator superfamily MFS_1 [Alicyclobacillus acidocaldarius subsp. acidocaldarius Tc-4-1]